MRVLDSHLHLWDPAVLRYGWLEGRLLGRFSVEERRAALLEAPPARRSAVFVQAECAPADSLAEVDWVSGLAADAGVRGIVAHLPMEDHEASREGLSALRGRRLVVGVRRLLQDEPGGLATSPEFVVSAGAVAEAGLAFDACVRHPQLTDVAALAEAVPELTVVLDHLGKPDVSAPPTARWRADLQRLADRPGTACKLSGLPAECSTDWTAAQLTPFLDAALAAFGPERLLFGGDWPVSWPYARWERFVTEWAQDAAPGHVDDILWANTERIYRLA
ncbi:amidohydrolase family protein [Microbacterium sp. zg.Y909]|uniref:amidohydrolase family protein n=1 Tax=Microbacterium sp. zg.Y909 TaxID=2969413 RepID=UPI00214B6B2A|nr:amidohydrolase family protein [Microbacterium sp. zg.Y909]MCR2824627.1 amidohydrolase family protein [Microbacterium sp. zg.Y909]